MHIYGYAFWCPEVDFGMYQQREEPSSRAGSESLNFTSTLKNAIIVMVSYLKFNQL
jgi:hypothetical protein